MMRPRAWLVVGALMLGGCASEGDVLPETALLARPLALRPGGNDAARLIAGMEIKEDWPALSALAVQQVAQRPTDDDWLFVLGYARLKAGDYPSATQALQRVADRTPEDPDASNLLGETLRLSGQTDKAVQVLEKSVQSHPNSKHGWFLLGDAYVDASRLERAKAAYRESLRLDPEYATALFGLARVLARVGPKDEYEQVAEQLQKLRPELLKAGGPPVARP